MIAYADAGEAQNDALATLREKALTAVTVYVRSELDGTKQYTVAESDKDTRSQMRGSGWKPYEHIKLVIRKVGRRGAKRKAEPTPA